jgi:hypothetical protein
MEMAREMTRNSPLVMQGAGRLVANVVGRGRMNPLNRRKQRERSDAFLSLLSPLPPFQDSNDLQFREPFLVEVDQQPKAPSWSSTLIMDEPAL